MITSKKIYLLRDPLSRDELKKKLFLDYNVPKDREYLYDIVTDHINIKYICPHCEAELIVEGNFISSAYASQVPRIKTTLDDYNKNIKSAVLKWSVGLQHCPICGAELIRKFPFTECFLSSKSNDHFMRDLQWYDWYREYKASSISMKVIHDWNNEGIKEKYESQGKTMSDYRKELTSALFDQVFIAPSIKRYAEFIQSCDSATLIQTTTLDKTTDFLKNYLLNLINMESNILCMSKRLEQLYILSAKYNRDVVFEQKYPLYNLTKEVAQKNQRLQMLIQELNSRETAPLIFTTVSFPPQPIEPQLQIPNFFNKKKVELLNTQAMNEYHEAMEKYRSDVESCKIQTEYNKATAEMQRAAELNEYHRAIEQCKDDLLNAQNSLKAKHTNIEGTPIAAAGAKQIIDDEIASLEEALKNTYMCRNELYSYNIIFEKYRNIVAISSFYEYLMAGRCDSLEGINGAYNIYENESRMDSIIIKLDEIKEKLDEIKSNQFMIYNKLKSIESSLYQLNSSMEKALSSLESIDQNTRTMSEHLERISRNTDVIAHNTAISAYYSKVNAELTNALGFMVALK